MGQVGDLPYTREQRGADLLLLLLLLLLPCTESETPWTGRSETCPSLLAKGEGQRLWSAAAERSGDGAFPLRGAPAVTNQAN